MQSNSKCFKNNTIGYVRRFFSLDIEDSIQRICIRNCILVPLTLAIILLLGAFIYNVYRVQYKEISFNVEKHLEAVQELFDKEIGADTQFLSATIEMLSRNENIKTAWLKKDRAELLQHTQPLLKDLFIKYQLTHFYFHDINRVNFLRVYKPENYGDTIERFTLLEAESTGRLSSGIELGRFGTVTLRVVYPWKINGRITGYIEMGHEIGHITKKIHQVLGDKLFISIYKYFLDHKEWKTGMEIVGRQWKWDQFPSSVIVSQTDRVVPKSLGNFLAPGEHEYMEMAEGLELSIKGRTYRVGVIPFFDVDDNEIGDIVALYDITEMLANSRQLIIGYTVICTAIGILLFVLFSKILKKVEKELIKHRRHLEDMVKERTTALATSNKKLMKEISEHKLSESEKEKLQHQLTQAQKMESIGRLAGGIAHDFNNILCVINGCAELCLLDTSHNDNGQLKKNLEHICSAGRRAANLTQQLLAFSRKQIIKQEPLNLNTVINKLGKLLRRLTREHIVINIVMAKDLWNIKVDLSQIEQVLMNIVVNANDVMPKNGKLTIKTTNVTIKNNNGSEHKPGEYVLLEITDTGYGMTDEEKELIFEPFFTTKEKGKGTGLGLATVYGIIKPNSGFISISSTLGKGTTFKIYLPRTEEVASTIALPVEEDVIGGKETILLVEDERDVRKLFDKLLSNLGYSVLKAKDGEDALKLYKKFHDRIDLLLTDVVMPKMSGSELSKKIKELSPEMKVLYMSGYNDDDISTHGILKKGVHFLQKPISSQSIANSVRNILDVEN